jgi:hypothetical protein
LGVSRKKKALAHITKNLQTEKGEVTYRPIYRERARLFDPCPWNRRYFKYDSV